MHRRRVSGEAAASLGLLAIVLVAALIIGLPNLVTAATTTTHTRTRITTTATVVVTTTATASAFGTRGLLVLLVLLATAACVAIIGGYVWGRKRARKDLLRASS